MKQQIKAVLFDLGGVVVNYSDKNKYLEFIKKVTSYPGLLECLEDFERGRIAMEVDEEFLQLFGMKRGDCDDFEKSALRAFIGGKNPFVAKALDSLRGKYILGLLTNNGFWDGQKTRTTLIDPGPHFDFLIESCKIGQRKPDASFYQVALEAIGAVGEECVFIDDLEMNCRGAEAMGMKAIWMKNGDGQSAMAELEAILGEQLL